MYLGIHDLEHSENILLGERLTEVAGEHIIRLFSDGFLADAIRRRLIAAGF